jgi:gamma-glutamylcyclotransferase (GGCT)/AIG2-like uncharacterized protein YtfP
MSGATQMTDRVRPMRQQYRVFVYGTLKRGGINHARVNPGIQTIEDAAIRGRLYRLSATIPALAIPPSDILAQGLMDYRAECRRQRHPVPTAPDATELVPPWRWIHGELFTFSEAERLAELDRFEGYHAAGHCLYRRVLAPVRLQSGAWVTAWVYTVGDIDREYLEPVEADCWR